MPTRRRRGRETEQLVAAHLRANGWPAAEPNAPSLPGSDVTGVPGVDLEVVARRGLVVMEKLAQQDRRLVDGTVGVVVMRPDGYGPATVGSWPAILRLDQLLGLLHAAGYGDPS